MITEFNYGEHPRQSLDIYSRASASSGEPVIVFWHGGSWQGGDKSGYKFMGKALSKLGSTVVIPNYRLYPEVKFPSFIEDGALAVAWVAKKYPDSKIFLMGHSAGAHIASMLTFEDTYLKNAGVNMDIIGGFIGISGPYNFTLGPKIAPVFSNSSKELWNPLDRLRYPKPALLIYGKRDRTVATSNSKDLTDKLTQLGQKPIAICYSLLGHISILLPFICKFVFWNELERIFVSFLNEKQN